MTRKGRKRFTNVEECVETATKELKENTNQNKEKLIIAVNKNKSKKNTKKNI